MFRGFKTDCSNPPKMSGAMRKWLCGFVNPCSSQRAVSAIRNHILKDRKEESDREGKAGKRSEAGLICPRMQRQSIHQNNASTLDGQNRSSDSFPWVTLFHSPNNRSDPNRFEILQSLSGVNGDSHPAQEHNAAPSAPDIPRASNTRPPYLRSEPYLNI